jgi:hypothetical protein
MVHLLPSKGSGERHRQAGHQAGNQATEHLHQINMGPLHLKVSINSRQLVNMALLRHKAVMDNLPHSSMALHRLSNPDTALLHLNSTVPLLANNTVLLLPSNTVPLRASAHPLSPRWDMALNKLRTSI